MADEPTPHFKEPQTAPGGRAQFEGSIPVLNVKSVAASVDYYVHKLGFQVEWDWGTPVTFANVRRGNVRVFLCENGQGAPGTWIFLDVDDVDRLHAEYQASGAHVIQPPTNFPWGAREMNVQDPDGHRLRLASEATGPSDGVRLPE